MRQSNNCSQEPPLITWAITAAILVVVMAAFVGLRFSGVNVLALLG